MSDLKAIIAGQRDFKVEPIDVPQWPETKGRLFIRSFSALARERMGQLRDNGKSPLAAIAAFSLCDSNGGPIFTEADIDMLACRDYDALTTIMDAVVVLNRLGDANQQEEAKK